MAPWQMDNQVEQDLAICRAIIDVYSNPVAGRSLIFRGGTALNKLCLGSPLRYSEDLDLVQLRSGPIGKVMSSIREVLNPWLGVPKTKQSEGRVTFVYRNMSEIPPRIPLKIKIEINTREHFTVFDIEHKEFEMTSSWNRGKAMVQTYQMDELAGTKLRALYQRKKGRDLFDLFQMVTRKLISSDRSLFALSKYAESQGVAITRRMFQLNLERKLQDSVFIHDIDNLVLPGTEYDAHEAANEVLEFLSEDSWEEAYTSS